MSTLRTVSFLAVKDLKRDKKIALLVIFLLAFSYINITFFAAFLNGLGNTFQEEVISTASGEAICSVPYPLHGQHADRDNLLRHFCSQAERPYAIDPAELPYSYNREVQHPVRVVSARGTPIYDAVDRDEAERVVRELNRLARVEA